MTTSSSTISSRIDLSQYMDKEEDDFELDFGEFDLNSNSLVGLRRGSSPAPALQRPLSSQTYDDTFSDTDSNLDSDNPLLPQHPNIKDNVSEFLRNYTGSGTINRLGTINKKTITKVTEDWGDELDIPVGTSLLSKFKQSTVTRPVIDDDPFKDDVFSSQQSPFANYFQSDPISEEEDLDIPADSMQLEISPRTQHSPLTLDVEVDMEIDPIVSNNPSTSLYSSNIAEDNDNSNPINTWFGSSESEDNYNDIEFPEEPSKLKVTKHKAAHRSSPNLRNEEDWLDDIDIPNDNVFTIKSQQNRLLQRKAPAPASKKLKSFTISDLFSSHSKSPTPINKVYSRVGLRPKTSRESFIPRKPSHPYLGNYRNITPISESGCNKLEFHHFHKPLSIGISKRGKYGDGTELDHLDNLPVSPTTEEKFTAKHPRPISPIPVESTSQTLKKMLNEFSDFQMDSLEQPSNKRRRPMLIQNLNSLKIQRTVGDMRFNPQDCSWEGNEEALRDFECVSPTRPALISNMGGHKRARKVGTMVFDPAQLKWFNTEPESDPFSEIPDLESNSGPPRILSDYGPGDHFYLSPTQKNDFYSSERSHRQFMNKWYVEGQGSFDHLYYVKFSNPR
ncbi:hypothetical protein CONCODRAFT_77729 [Conidiobolus coronatus NRRL 28638]|uniref:Uncharacterized protein n=1 Tax=Conidiobolus coronatus (strain ATCC 28846 / CBS 209.66 / NRRL 28638) TaxID=796925 RepID=A0A137PC38_CONC2|nr:hypothetical protein CONCODRAFT_77729 [Conidiobolus coronatus NRRL 28638]|eukprot:KXN72543.1 hypothetical protein CONCODRAFT_77729 [Conidiobolus coronatus NRRL 28638]